MPNYIWARYFLVSQSLKCTGDCCFVVPQWGGTSIAFVSDLPSCLHPERFEELIYSLVLDSSPQSSDLFFTEQSSIYSFLQKTSSNGSLCLTGLLSKIISKQIVEDFYHCKKNKNYELMRKMDWTRSENNVIEQLK